MRVQQVNYEELLKKCLKDLTEEATRCFNETESLIKIEGSFVMEVGEQPEITVTATTLVMENGKAVIVPAHAKTETNSITKTIC